MRIFSKKIKDQKKSVEFRFKTWRNLYTVHVYIKIHQRS